MKIPYSFSNELKPDIRKVYLSSDEFKEELIHQNISRGKMLALVTSAFEMVFLLIDIISSFLDISHTF
jgi:hypothetical protein